MFIISLIFIFIKSKLLVAPLVGAGIAAGASLLSTGASVYAAGKMNSKTRAWNEKMYDIQKADNLAAWERTNAYNSPLQQMQRLKEAGLNPNLVYDNGAAHSAPAISSADTKSYNPQSPDFSGISQAASAGIQAYQDITLQSEQVKNMQAQRKNMDLDATLKVLQMASDGIKNSRDSLELAKARQLYDTSIQEANERLRALRTDTDVKVSREVRDAAMGVPNLAAAFERVANISANTAVAKQQVENLKKTGMLQAMEINMRKLGLSYNDSVILRVLAQFAQGQSLPEVVKNLWDKIQGMAGSLGKDMPLKDDVSTTSY